VVELLQSNRQLESSLDQNFEILASLAWTTLDERRSESRQQQQLAFTTLLIVIVAGLALLVVLAAILLRSLGGSIGKLLEAAENIQQGDFEARVRIRTRDELQDLGMAFNAMAQFLGDRRRQQLDYNEIVSLLNSTLNADDIMTGSLREIVQRSGSSIGAFFTVEEGDSVLHLNKAFGLGEGSLARTSYNTGVGLVGQAAKTRRKILVSPVPPGFFSIDTGLGIIQPEAVLILPVVHVDRLLGVFVLVNAREYEEETLTFIEEVVFQFGVAYNNARFVDKLESTAATLRERTEELMRQSARLEQVNRELETANRLKSDFLANVTHELRTPLNSIIGFTELVLEKLVPTDEKMTRHLETVLRNARSLLGLINDLLNITKIESGKVTLTLGPVNLPRLIEDCLQTVSPLVQHERVELESRIEPSIQNIYSDWGKLKQVILNLLSNAAKFTEDGAIRVEARPLDDDWVELAVSDTGIGIHSEDLPFIFDKFRQVDSSSSRKYGGTGLGLSITSELVKLFGGRITAKSEPGAGSTFIVQLPMSSAAVLTGVGSQAEIVARKTQTMLPVVQERRPSTLGQAVKLKTAPELAPVSVTAPAELDHSSRNVIIVLDEQLESVVRLREGLRVDGYDVKSAFVIADAIALLRSGSPSALVWGEPLPEDDPECQRSQLGELLLSTKTPLIALGDAQLDARVEAVARLPRPATAQAVLELLRALPTES
jgi:signal transduction histidine kinase